MLADWLAVGCHAAIKVCGGADLLVKETVFRVRPSHRRSHLHWASGFNALGQGNPLPMASKTGSGLGLRTQGFGFRV